MNAKKAAKKTPVKKPTKAQHGGKREGSGRPKGDVEWQQLNVRVRPEEFTAIETIKNHYGLATDSEAVRFAINTEARRCRAASPPEE